MSLNGVCIRSVFEQKIGPYKVCILENMGPFGKVAGYSSWSTASCLFTLSPYSIDNMGNLTDNKGPDWTILYQYYEPRNHQIQGHIPLFQGMQLKRRFHLGRAPTLVRIFGMVQIWTIFPK